MAALRQRRSDLKRQVRDAAKEERNPAKKRQLMQAGEPGTKGKLSISVANDFGRPPRICRLVTCSSCCSVPTSNFFCWWLLGLIPGGTPFSQLIETLCLQQPKEMLNINSVQKHAKGHGYQQSPNTSKESRVSRGRKEEGSGEIQRKAPMPEWEDAIKEEGFGETRRKHLCRSQKCA